jgi:hypothetical protein
LKAISPKNIEKNINLFKLHRVVGKKPGISTGNGAIPSQ